MDVVAHFKPEEIQQMDALQGGSDTQKYGAPYYGKLWDIIQSNPEIKEKTAKAVQELMGMPIHEAEEITSNLNKLVSTKFGNPNNQPLDYPQNQTGQELAQEGDEGDTMIAFMPDKMLEFLWNLYPEEIPIEERINEETGLPEFFLPILASILLPVIGGAIGSAISGGNNSSGGIASLIGSSLGGYAGSLIPGMGEIGKIGGQFFGGIVGNALGNSFRGGGGKQENANQNGIIADYNKYLKEARERDKERINKYNTQTEKYTRDENKRLSQYQQDVNQHRLNEIAAEKQYQGDRSKMINAYNARYHPLIDPQLISDMVDKYGVL